MNKKLIITASTAALLALPLIGLAFTAGPSPIVDAGAPPLSIEDLIQKIFDFVWPILVAFVIIMFIVSAFLFITAQGDPAKIGQGRQAIIWGVVGIVVLILAYSILFIVKGQLGL